MSFFDESEKTELTDAASRIGAAIGNLLVVVAYLIVIYPVVHALMR